MCVSASVCWLHWHCLHVGCVPEPWHAFRALGSSEVVVKVLVRFSIGYFRTKDDVETTGDWVRGALICLSIPLRVSEWKSLEIRGYSSLGMLPK